MEKISDITCLGKPVIVNVREATSYSPKYKYFYVSRYPFNCTAHYHELDFRWVIIIELLGSSNNSFMNNSSLLRVEIPGTDDPNIAVRAIEKGCKDLIEDLKYFLETKD